MHTCPNPLTKKYFWVKINSGFYSPDAILPGNPAVLPVVFVSATGYLSEYSPNAGVLSLVRCGFRSKLVSFNYKRKVMRGALLLFYFQYKKGISNCLWRVHITNLFQQYVFDYYIPWFSGFTPSNNRVQTSSDHQTG